jgi:hypothetical protein
MATILVGGWEGIALHTYKLNINKSKAEFWVCIGFNTYIYLNANPDPEISTNASVCVCGFWPGFAVTIIRILYIFALTQSNNRLKNIPRYKDI